MSVATIYCKEVRNNFKKYFGNWEPTDIIKLGDIGIIENDMFIHKGNIENFGIKNLAVQIENGIGNKTFSTKDSVTVQLKAKATIGQVNTNAGIEISFSKGNSLFINALDCSIERISDKISLGEKILDLYKIEKKWKKNWVVITDVIISKNTTVAISETANSNISLEAKSNAIQQIDILDASISLGVVRNNQVGYCAESRVNITPFFCICGIKDTWFEEAKFETLTTKQYLPRFRSGGGLGFIQAETEEFGEIE
ncbi:MAG: hypothetical protein AB7S72_01575 [Draconibacterium sp.]